MRMNAFQKGVQAGMRQGQRLTLRKQLEARFGPLGPFAQLRFEMMDGEQLEALTLALLEARSLQELGLED